MKCTLGILFMVAAWATNAVAQGTVLWDESINGPLSNDGSNPTQLGVFQNGTNSILGATQYIPNAIYGDYFTFVVPNGNGVSRLVLSVDKPVAVWLGTPDFGSQYGYVINPANADLLPQWGLSSIGAGTFGMYIKDYDLSSGASTANYRLDFFVQTVPEPGAVCLFLVGAGVVGVLRWKKFPGIARTSAIQRPGVRDSGHQLSRSMIQSLVEGRIMQRVIKAVLALVLFCARAHGQGTTLWDESINGPLSDGTSPPTPLGTLKAGTNSVIGTTDAEPTGSTWFVHYDFFAFDIPSNSVVSALYLQVDKANVWTWIGDPTLSSQLAFASNPSSGNLVVQWGLSQIDSGSYAMYMANHDLHQVTSTASYRLDFFVQAVPEPGAVSFIILGAGVVGCFRWKRFRWMKRISAFRRPTGQATN